MAEISAEKILDIFRHEALEHKRQENFKRKQDYCAFVSDSCKRKKVLQHNKSRVRKGY